MHLEVNLNPCARSSRAWIWGGVLESLLPWINRRLRSRTFQPWESFFPNPTQTKFLTMVKARRAPMQLVPCRWVLLLQSAAFESQQRFLDVSWPILEIAA